jgi:hypothetical protein
MEPTMGLAERRIAKDFETTVLPGLQKQIDEAAGFAVPIEVRWDTLTKNESMSHNWKECWPKLYFVPIVEAFQKICVDDMGKEALKEKLKKIVIQDAKDSYSSYWATFENGLLTLDYQFANVDSFKDRADVLQQALEKAL